MASITGSSDASILSIKRFLGLNENPDGDTTLKTGEMAAMRNFRVTPDGHLQIRPGTRAVADLAGAYLAATGEAALPEGDVHLYGAWRGTVGGQERMLCAYAGLVFQVDVETGECLSRGSCARAETTFFPFAGKVYLLNGSEYLCWDGGEDTGFAPVEGYVPLIQTATTPAGEGTLVENVNRLTGKRRVEFSPDGRSAAFQLPEKELDEVAAVTLDGAAVTGYTTDLAAGKVTLSATPTSGTNTLEIVYRKGTGAREEVTGMRYSELFNGSTDTRVFLYGNGTNKTIYSGVRYDTGEGSAEYFPDLYEAAVGESNTPITALVRHYSRLMAYKPSSAWVIQYGTVTLDDATTTAAYYVLPVNRQLGNEAVGQVKLLENNPLTLDVGSVYQWASTTSSAYINASESNAKRVSDRVASTLREFDIARTKTFNLKGSHEYWFLYERRALILNYSNNTWYLYEDLPFDALLEVEGEAYGLSNEGKVLHLSHGYRNDDGAPIRCYAATGAMDFDREWLLKYSPMIFVAMQPESNARVYVTAETNRRSDYPEKVVAYNLATYLHTDFNHFSFATNRKPQVRRLKMKVKKATFYRLAFSSNSASATATVLGADVRLRYAGYVK